LETICLKCLHKDPCRRYSTAAALGEDLGRFLNGRPVHARPARGLERAWRWARRRPALTALGGVLVLAALGMVGAGIWLAFQLGQAGEQAVLHADGAKPGPAAKPQGGRPEEEDEPQPFAIDPPKGLDIYRHLLKSCTLVLARLNASGNETVATATGF